MFDSYNPYNPLNYPLVLAVLVFLLLWGAARIGATVIKRHRALEEEVREDFSVIVAATLTLLGLIIGFSFSMAVGRYDQRKNLEEEEANAIGTEYLRAGLLPAADAEKIRAQLRAYADLRLTFYRTRDIDTLRDANARTAKLQNEMWTIVQGAAAAQPTPVVTLVAAGMNDVINSQGYTQAAWWNRIPHAAWVLMILMAVCCNVLIGYGARRVELEGKLMLVLPAVVAIAFLLIADIDSPRGGVIRVRPQNLESLAESLRAP